MGGSFFPWRQTTHGETFPWLLLRKYFLKNNKKVPASTPTIMWKAHQSTALNSDTTKNRYAKSFSPLMQYIEEVIDESLNCTCNSYLHVATSMRECRKKLFLQAKKESTKFYKYFTQI